MKTPVNMLHKAIIILLTVFILTSCGEPYTPKPSGYIRIDLPEPAYQSFDSLYPYAFEYPTYSRFEPDTREFAEPYWANLTYPQFKGTLHLSYKPVSHRDELLLFFEDARNLSRRHIPKATSIIEQVVIDKNNHVYGMVYLIKGRDAASPLQFYLTDSTSHFLRGSLYFEVTPNNDSLAPVIGLIEQDVRRMIESLHWK
jgi:gliding motility-associated lipoprotein GldD